MSISGTNTTLHTFTPFTGASFVNDCLLQPMLHINHPLFQFADITDPYPSTAALFSRFYSHRVQTWAIKAALFLARLILGFHVQYAIEIGSNCNFQVSQGSVETYLRWDGESLWHMCTTFRQKSDSERILYIGLHLPKLWSKVVYCFLRHGVYFLFHSQT